jgi:hypothetical protein
MSPILVASCYASANALSLYPSPQFRAKHLMWHALSGACLRDRLAHLPALVDSLEGTLLVDGSSCFYSSGASQLRRWRWPRIFKVVGLRHR